MESRKSLFSMNRYPKSTTDSQTLKSNLTLNTELETDRYWPKMTEMFSPKPNAFNSFSSFTFDSTISVLDLSELIKLTLITVSELWILFCINGPKTLFLWRWEKWKLPQGVLYASYQSFLSWWAFKRYTAKSLWKWTYNEFVWASF